VGYPLLPLGSAVVQKVDYIDFIRKLERVLITAVATFGVQARQVEGLTGIWIHSKQSSMAKLAAIGVKVDARGISHHGFALNVNPDMRYWEGIIGCGLPYPEISLAQLLDAPPPMEKVIEAVLRAFQQEFDYENYEIQSALPHSK
jgi:lipoate-protein ligase B